MTKVNKFNLHDLEKDIFKAFLQSKKIWIQFESHIESNFFTNKADQFLFQIFKKYWSKYKHLPTKNQCLTFLKKAEGLTNSKITANDISKIESIYDSLSTNPLMEHELEHLSMEMRKFIKRNKLEIALFESAANIADEDKYDEIEAKIKEAVMWKDDVDLGISIFNNIDQRYNKLEEIYKNVIKTPWAQLNDALGGGLFEKEIYCIIAPSGVGKSIALSNIATYVYSKLQKKVVYISLELSEARLGQRIDVSITGIKMGEIIQQRDKVKEYWKKLIKNNPGDLRIKEFPTSSVSSKIIENYIYSLSIYENFKPDLIIIDYADILLPNEEDKKAGSYINAGRVVEQMRALGYIYECPVLTATQSNRGGYNIDIADFNETHIGESMKKLFTLDTLIVLNSTDSQRMVGEADMKILKCRNGAKNSIINFSIKYEYFRLEEM